MKNRQPLGPDGNCFNGAYKMEILIEKNEIIIPKGKVLLELRNVKTGRVTRDMIDNMVVTLGKESIADALRGTTSDSRGIITYCALGTGSTAPALGDSVLETEIERKLVSVRSVANNIATFETFFTTAEGNGSLREAGLFGDDASDTVDTGTLFCRLAIDREKTASDTLTLRWRVIIG